MNPIAAMLNMFIDPAESAKAFGQKFAWIWPLLVSGAIVGAVSFMMSPIAFEVMRRNPPGNLTAEQLERSAGMMQTIGKITAVFAPVMLGVMAVIGAALIMAACAVLDLKPKFAEVFTMLSFGSVIHALGAAAGFAVIKLKGDDLNSIADLRPALGLDIFFHEGLPKPILGTLNYFSIFNIWYIVVIALAFAALAGTSKGKAFAATAPAWMLGWFFAVIGSFFQR